MILAIFLNVRQNEQRLNSAFSCVMELGFTAQRHHKTSYYPIPGLRTDEL